MPPHEPSAPQGPPHMAPPQAPQPPHAPQSPQPGQFQPGPPPGFAVAQPPAGPPSDAPSPLGLVLAGVGLALLCVSVLLPRVSVDEPDSEYAFYSFSGLLGYGGLGIDTSTVVLMVALVAAVGFSAHRNPAFRWPARIAAVGIAALTAAFAYHPVTLLRQYIENAESESDYDGYDEYGDAVADTSIEVTADNGVYLTVIAVALLAVSAFLMQTRRRPVHLLPVQQFQAPVPAGQPGAEPTITVNPG